LVEIQKQKKQKQYQKETWFYSSLRKNLRNLLIIKMNKSINSYKTISEVVKILGLKSKRGQSLPTHTIRFWEKEFKQIKPKIFNGNRRYYDKKNIELLKKVHFLLKDQGMTINGVKKILNNKESLKLDEISNQTIKANNLKNKLVKISSIVKNLKKLK
jgi:DNA-binding transcriptional MerR regulator